MARLSGMTAIILAAGEGTRMKSGLPKVLHMLGGKSMLAWVLQTAHQAGAARRIVVLGRQADRVKEVLPKGVETAIQPQQLGTGHAVQMAAPLLSRQQGHAWVLCGDTPLIQPATLQKLGNFHLQIRAAATILTARVDRPAGYGRIVRVPGAGPWVARIVEEKDATRQERQLHEVNSGVYCFALPQLWQALRQVGNHNRKSEYYLTDVIACLHAKGERVAALEAPDFRETTGVNHRKDLAQAAAFLNQRCLGRLMDQGVTVLDPATTWVDAGVRIGRDTVLLPGTHLQGDTRIGPECLIGPQTLVVSSVLGRGVKVLQSVVEYARLGNQVSIGPFSHVRSGTQVEAGAHIGNFAEINRSRLGAGVKMGHFSYLGDAVVGPGANIGAGAITANYDGKHKHPTHIGAGAFIGSGSVLVGPSRVGQQALLGAGAVLTPHSAVPAGHVAVGMPARVIKKLGGKQGG